MSPVCRGSVLLLVIVGLCCLASFASEPTKRPRRPKTAAPAEEPVPAEAPAVPLPPATLEQMPSRPPVVTVENGELTIVSQNSSLADILQAVSSRTGASIDMPEGADERVAAKLGPDPIRKVLDQLLGGSKWNYVMMGSETDPTALTQILLFSKPGSDADKKSAASSVQNNPTGRHSPTQRQPVAPDGDSASAASSGDEWEYVPAAADARAAAEEPTPAPAPAAQSAAQSEPAKVAENPPAQPQVAFPAPASSPEEQPRTPNIKSMQEVLQDMYNQRQKMIQQQNQQQQQQ